MSTKRCSRCDSLKEINQFKKYQRSKDGLWCYCKDCDKIVKGLSYRRNREEILDQQKYYRIKNKEIIRERNTKNRANNKKEKNKRDLEYYYANKDKILAKARERYSKNKAKIKSKVKAYTKANRSKVTAIKAKYRAAKYNATPDWLTKEHLEQIEEFYETARDLAWLNEGEILQVDHIVPLQGKEVCGLHVPWNLQILSKSKNISKFNNLININY
jgi:hypothetical protein